MSSNNIGPFPNKYDYTSKMVRKASGDLDYTKKALVTTTDTVFKEGTTDTVDKKGKQNLMWWINPPLLLFQQKIRLTQ